MIPSDLSTGSLPVEHDVSSVNRPEGDAPARTASAGDLHGPAWTGVEHHENLSTPHARAKLAARAVTAPRSDILAGFSPRDIASIRRRLESKTSPEPNTGCWLWLGADTAEGYGKMGIGLRGDGTRRVVYAHRLAYELDIGPIPEGMTIDHLCRVRCCVNPRHLEAVTIQVNTARRAPPRPGEMSARVRQSWATRRARFVQACAEGTEVAP